jgi:hypothetical protein
MNTSILMRVDYSTMEGDVNGDYQTFLIEFVLRGLYLPSVKFFFEKEPSYLAVLTSLLVRPSIDPEMRRAEI